MTPSIDRLEALFSDAVALPPAERSALLDRECAGDAELRARVEALLRAGIVAGAFLETTAVSRRAEASTDAKVGRYHLLEKIGEGGVGIVFRAEQTEPLRREVALKVIKPGMDTAEVIARFESERQALAMMNHPHIARVFDAGATPDGRPYFVMELVSGLPITRFCDERQLSVEERLELFAKVCFALHHAHAKGIVHRDVKASNVLVAKHEGELTPKVIDFGIAKATSFKLTDKTFDTLLPRFVGTPRAMSPEHFADSDHEIDARSDVYSLGVLLCELLTSRTPLGPLAPGESFWEIRRRICEGQPPGLEELLRQQDDALLEATARARQLPAEGLLAAARGRLSWIAQQALKKDRAQRYPTARALAEDVQRYLRSERIEAEPPGLLEGVRTRLHGSRAARWLAHQLRERPSAPPPSPPARWRTLPVAANLLVGRVRELAELQSLLARGGIRLVTLTGPGGIGKTRLGLAAAENVADQFADGVTFVDLSAVRNATLIAANLARALQLRELSNRDVLTALKQALHEKECLLVLDNFEQLREGSGILSEILGAAPRVKILVTSRAALHLYGEHEYSVPSLSVPATGQLAPEQCVESDAVKLFLSRVREWRPGFALDAQSSPDIAELCRRLEGLPLAIELVAARTKYLGIRGVLERVGDRLALLTGGARDRSPRQQTMRGAIAWSYELLSENERRLFRGLGVFAGRSTLPAAVHVLGLAPARLEEGLFALADQSLITIPPGEGAESGFTMLDTLREYALEQLRAEEDEGHLRDRHAAHFLALAEAAEPELIGPGQVAALARLEEAHDNLRAAHTWYSSQGRMEEKLRLCAALGRFWRIRGYLAEGRARFGDVASIASIPATLQAKVLREAGWLIRDQGDYATARNYLQTSLEAARAIGDRSGAARTLLQQGFVARYEGAYAEAEALYERSLEEARVAEDHWCIAASLGSMGLLARDREDSGAAERLLTRSLAAATSIGDVLGIAWALMNLGLVACVRGALPDARARLEKALTMWESLGDRQNIAYCLHNLGLVDAADRDLRSAQQRQEESIRMLEQVGDRRGIAFVLESLAMLAKPAVAVCIAGAAAALRAELASAPPPGWKAEYEQALSVASAALDEVARNDAWTRDGRMTLRDAIDYACQETAAIN